MSYPQHESGQLSLATFFLLTPMAALPNFAALSHRKLPDAEYGVDWSLGPGGKSVARGGKNWPLFRAADGAVAYAVVCCVERTVVS